MDLLKELDNAFRALSWCHQWLEGDDAKMIGKDLRRFRKALAEARKQDREAKKLRDTLETIRVGAFGRQYRDKWAASVVQLIDSKE